MMVQPEAKALEVVEEERADKGSGSAEKEELCLCPSCRFLCPRKGERKERKNKRLKKSYF